MKSSIRGIVASALITVMAATMTLDANASATHPTTSDDAVFAPVDRPGPPLSVSDSDLLKSVTCTANATNAQQNVVLFVPGTTFNPTVNYGWSWFPALDKLGLPYCSVTLPENAMSDTQVSAEYVVYAIRHVHQISGRKLSVIGHSQGGTEPRFALRFWPDLRPMVDDYVTLAGTNHGALGGSLLCPPMVGCAPSIYQQTLGSQYTKAMNSYQETFPGISYTDIYTKVDELVQPNLDDNGSTSLHGGGGRITNVALQQVCPLDVTSEHLAIGTYDPVAYALTIDALTHDGPADPARVSRSVCGQLFMPGVDPTKFATNYANLAGALVTEVATYPHVAKEPALKPYVFANR